MGHVFLCYSIQRGDWSDELYRIKQPKTKLSAYVLHNSQRIAFAACAPMRLPFCTATICTKRTECDSVHANPSRMCAEHAVRDSHPKLAQREKPNAQRSARVCCSTYCHPRIVGDGELPTDTPPTTPTTTTTMSRVESGMARVHAKYARKCFAQNPHQTYATIAKHTVRLELDGLSEGWPGIKCEKL